ncbi:right-handed parallel beta-helix repeat-containing protein [Thermogutta sp.]|uniref:right-handed parallel beta-helix repeat-containing protein n=1 Tax=Thermogutta sp. TaxID=1962930 RepID=UPI003C7A363D
MRSGVREFLIREKGITPQKVLGRGPCFEAWAGTLRSEVSVLVKVADLTGDVGENDTGPPDPRGYQSTSRLTFVVGSVKQAESLASSLRRLVQVAQHPGVVKLFDWAAVGGSLVLCYYPLPEPPDFLGGLYANTNVHGISADRALEICQSVAATLDYLNSEGIFHGYLKPTHIGTWENGVVVSEAGLLSFRQWLWRWRRVPLSWEYVPPELKPEGQFHPSTDLYCLAQFYLQLRTGWIPNPEERPRTSHAPHPVSELENWEKELVASALASDPDQRPRLSCMGWVTELSAAYESSFSGQIRKVAEITLTKGTVRASLFRRLLPNGILRLEAGPLRLRSKIILRQPVRIYGEPHAGAKLIVSGKESGFCILTRGAVIFKNLAMRLLSPELSTLVTVSEGRLIMRNCRLRGCKENDAVEVLESARAVIQRCSFLQHDTGVLVSGHARARIENCRFVRNAFAGILLDQSSQSVVSACRFSLNGQQGIYVGQQAEAELRDNHVVGNLDVGIAIFDYPRVILDRNRCENNGGVGIQVMYAKHLFLIENVCQDNKGSGVYCGAAAYGALLGNECRRNKRSGIVIGYPGRWDVSYNTAEDNQEHGIFVVSEAVKYDPPLNANLSPCLVDVPVLKGNECISNGGAGICVRSHSQVVLVANLCKNNAGPGILFAEGSGGAVLRNTSQENAGGNFSKEESCAIFAQDNLFK